MARSPARLIPLLQLSPYRPNLSITSLPFESNCNNFFGKIQFARPLPSEAIVYVNKNCNSDFKRMCAEAINNLKTRNNNVQKQVATFVGSWNVIAICTSRAGCECAKSLAPRSSYRHMQAYKVVAE